MEILPQNSYLYHLAPGAGSSLKLQHLAANPFTTTSAGSSFGAASVTSSPSKSFSNNSNSTSTTPTSNSPSPSPNSMISANMTWRKCCTNSSCLLCTKGTPKCLCMNHPSWTLILRVVFFALAKIHPDKEYFNLKKEVYVYLNDHWEILSPTQAQSANWKRQVQDALSHSRFFRSGRHTLRCNGYWQLKILCNPWTYNSSKQFEALRFEDIQPHSPYSPSFLSSQSSSPVLSSEIPWRFETISFASSPRDNKYVTVDKMDIKKLLSCNNSDSDIEQEYEVSSPLSSESGASSSGGSTVHAIAHFNANANYNINAHHAIQPQQYNASSSSSSSPSNTFSTPSNFKFINSASSANKKPRLDHGSSPSSSPRVADAHFLANLSSLPCTLPLQLHQLPSKSPLSKGDRHDFDEIVSSKIHQMKSILNCTD
ncbi:hypothetical protein SAMD00019534_013180 [Acytostelium subglobosum LB1]|uniref:hypothetical protein n=1 Tax=Acytostelium subglobosum LB1 TaxID=1410327 RepID=UPI000644B9B9|nr:hypothetical protein SAMD00019534_013180 [Acytostelium subglobosum LB1]GAM18143.1 hypothetical protein SAMD00019534_013180 [Acytostelium subglobosum LB1]|eukprot:XP_012758739.1 hypothetical protein SAMD00019534_013180 [Acytostelium subglobosum LB1]